MREEEWITDWFLAAYCEIDRKASGCWLLGYGATPDPFLIACGQILDRLLVDVQLANLNFAFFLGCLVFGNHCCSSFSVISGEGNSSAWPGNAASGSISMS